MKKYVFPELAWIADGGLRTYRNKDILAFVERKAKHKYMVSVYQGGNNIIHRRVSSFYAGQKIAEERVAQLQ